MKTIDALRWGENRLKECAVENARQESVWVMSEKVLETDSSDGKWMLDRESELSSGQMERFRSIVEKRCKGEPLAYLLGSQEFMGLDFVVDSRVLVPRPETETLVTRALSYLNGISKPSIADVGTGSGIIAVILAQKLAECRVWATDLSAPALDVAVKNAMIHKIDAQVRFVQGELPFRSESFDAVVSNPPYIRTGDLEELPREVRCEPRIALDGGTDGQRVIFSIAAQSFRCLKSGGALFVETGFDGAQDTAAIFKKCGFEKIEITKDFAGIERVVSGIKI